MIRKDKAQWIGVKIPAIISKELFDKANTRKKYNMACFRGSHKVQLLSDLTYCGRCNVRCRAIRRHYSVERKDGVHLYQKTIYRCPKRGAGHNPEIDSRVLELCVMDMIRKEMLDSENLQEHLETFNSNSQDKAAKSKKELGKISARITQIKAQKERILDLYASGGLEQEEYMRRIRNYESEIELLQKEQNELIKNMPAIQSNELIEESLNEYCKQIKLEFKKCNDFESKRKFLLDHIKKVSYCRISENEDAIKLQGSIPIKLEGIKTCRQSENLAKIKFEIERTIDRKELMIKARRIEIQSGMENKKQIASDDYGKLALEHAPELNP